MPPYRHSYDIDTRVSYEYHTPYNTVSCSWIQYSSRHRSLYYCKVLYIRPQLLQVHPILPGTTRYTERDGVFASSAFSPTAVWHYTNITAHIPVLVDIMVWFLNNNSSILRSKSYQPTGEREAVPLVLSPVLSRFVLFVEFASYFWVLRTSSVLVWYSSSRVGATSRSSNLLRIKLGRSNFKFQRRRSTAVTLQQC